MSLEKYRAFQKTLAGRGLSRDEKKKLWNQEKRLMKAAATPLPDTGYASRRKKRIAKPSMALMPITKKQSDILRGIEHRVRNTERLRGNITRSAKRTIVKGEIAMINKELNACEKKINECKKTKKKLRNAKARLARTDKNYVAVKRVRKARV